MDSPIVTDALVANRDGIVGTYDRTLLPPSHLALETAGNMKRWARERREQVVDFELHSRIAISRGTGKSSHLMTVWHQHVTRGAESEAPAAKYHPLVRISRPTEAVFHRQLDLVVNYADLRADRLSEVLAQCDGPTPFLASVAYLAPHRSPWTLELLGAIFRLAQFVEFRLKHGLACRRPNEYSPQIQPMILTPEHGSFPSGHSTETFAMAIVLVELLRASPVAVNKHAIQSVQLLRQAARIAINRQVAGVHFPVDSAAGAFLGLTLGAYFCRRLTEATHYDAWFFNGREYPEDADFNWTEWYDIAAAMQIGPFYARALPAQELGEASPVLAWLWKKALAEWS